MIIKQNIIIILIMLFCMCSIACGSESGDNTGSNDSTVAGEVNEPENDNSANTYEVDGNSQQAKTESMTEVSVEISFDNLSIGDTVYFGSYEQDGDYANGKESIEWEVIDEQDGNYLLASTHTLAKQPYHTTTENVTWATCYLRTWLNDTFLKEAFTETEQSYICTTTVSTQGGGYWQSVNSEDTEDKVFILTSGEIVTYWEDSDDRNAPNTSVVDGMAEDWLRSNSIRYHAQYVDYTGSTSYSGEMRSLEVTIETGVRPAIWVSVTADSEAKAAIGSTAHTYTQVGDTVTFGCYSSVSQKWIVAKIEDDKFMLVSENCLKKSNGTVYVKMAFDTSGGTWDVSSLREWLNGEYLTEGFTENEIAQILTTTVVTSGCADTEDKVFLLSKSEAEEIFPTAKERITGVATGGNIKGWWLRDDHFVNNSGSINNHPNGELSVRPAIWIQNEDYLLYINAYQY
ncbi:MAG: DUF6273 domain-containing protein [Lachnospiraceae bacterium]|nr:DUF6273 domain-containing protein [Lachnospiraceae bacterium]